MTTFMVAVLMLAGAQAAPDWSRVSSLSSGANVRVETSAGSVTGQFISATADAITLRLSARESTFSRANITKVQLRTGKSHRLRNAGIGFVAGLALGAVAYKATCSGSCLAEGAVAWTVPLELAGAITGAALPSGGWQTIYER
jgi:uncharacterized protein YfiM (DUF2279 family)